MRYFQTSNASRPYRVGNDIFTFEPAFQVGGNWHGVLAVEESAASSLAAGKFPQVKEISAEEYDAAKKKPLPPNSSFFELRQSSPKPAPLRPESVIAPSAPSSVAKTELATANASPAKVEVRTARVEPPQELPDAGTKKGK